MKPPVVKSLKTHKQVERAEDRIARSLPQPQRKQLQDVQQRERQLTTGRKR